MMEHALHELPLALFTTFCLIGGGAFIAIAQGHCAILADDARDRVLKKPMLVAAVLVILGLVCSIFHLTQPLHGIYVLSHLSSSPLSQELLVTLIFVVLMLVYVVLVCAGKLKGSARTILSWLVALAALVTAVFIARAYMIDTIPSWNNPVMIASLVGFLLIGAAVSFGWIVSMVQGGSSEGQVNLGLMKRMGIICLVVGAVLALIGTGAQYVAASHMTTAAMTGSVLAQGMFPLLVSAAVLGVIALLLAFSTLTKRGSQAFAYGALVFALGAVLCARLVFYGLQISVGI